MNDIENYTRYRKRRQNAEKLRNRLDCSYGVCPLCGRDGVKLYEHHYGRRKCNDEVIYICGDCHEHFCRCELFEHPPLEKGKKTKEEMEGRLLLGISDIIEYVAYEIRQIALKKIKPAEIETGPD